MSIHLAERANKLSGCALTTTSFLALDSFHLVAVAGSSVGLAVAVWL
jgi:hypothetical protein